MGSPDIKRDACVVQDHVSLVECVSLSLNKKELAGGSEEKMAFGIIRT